jgi:antitoxin HicB
MKNLQLFSIRLHLEPNPDGIYTVTSPDVPGLVTEGRTPDEILRNVQDALKALLEAWQELGTEPPPALRPVLSDRPQTIEILVSV